MTAGRVPNPAVIKKGAVFEYYVAWKDSEGTAIPLTDAFIHCQFRSCDKGDLLFDLSTDNGGVVVNDPASGQYQLYISADDTDAVGAYNNAVFDVFITPSGQEPLCQIEGDAVIIERVTQ